MQRPVVQTSTTTQSDSTVNRAAISPRLKSSPTSMAATTQQTMHRTLPTITQQEQRPTLPPFSYIDPLPDDRRTKSPLITPPISRGYTNDPFHKQALPQLSPSSRSTATSSDPFYQHASSAVSHRQGALREGSWHGQQHQANKLDQSDNPLKRNFGMIAQHHQSYPPPVPQPSSTTNYPEPHISPRPITHSQYNPGACSSYSDPSTPSQTQSVISYMGQGNAQEAKAASISSTSRRLSLHIRQQPRAARAGPDGKDRRAIDPPPVLQLLIDDFDIEDEADMNELRSSYFVVHCRLVSTGSPRRDLSTLSSVNDDGTIDVQRLLLGTLVSSPFFCEDDPDPVNMPSHPVTSAAERPPSPTSRFIQSRNVTKTKSKSQKQKTTPGSFFIFADLSVRKAGEYRLEFALMKIDANSMVAGKTLPVIHSVVSSVFKVVNAKDFDQVQPSTELVKGLLDRGAGFPLKLKKGIREGQRKKLTQGESDDEDEDDD